MTSHEEDECSSYGTGESEREETLDIWANIASNALIEKFEDIKCCISMLDATQNVIVKKLESMEKVVTLVQEDVTWVRGDVGVVHEILEIIAEHVSMLNPTVAEVEGVPEHRSIQVSAWGP